MKADPRLIALFLCIALLPAAAWAQQDGGTSPRISAGTVRGFEVAGSLGDLMADPEPLPVWRLAALLKPSASAATEPGAADEQATEQSSSGQDAGEQQPEGEQEEQEEQRPGLLVYLDCGFRICDQDYLRQEITFVNYVRDREDAQVQILVTQQDAGGGEEFTFDFIGLEEFEGDDIRLVWTSSNTNTEDEEREGIAQMIRAGMVHYIAKTPLIHDIEIRQEAERADQRFLVVDPEDDPWNFWVFRLSVNGQIGGEDRRSNYQLRFNGSANRTTEAWKVRFNSYFRNDENTFVLNDGSESIGTRRSWAFSHQTVKSLSEHWGLSGKAAVWNASFTNHDLVVVGAPGIEYNFFPYSESSRRLFTITYELGVGYNQYIEETIFLETDETLIDHTLLANLDVVQPWGELEGGVDILQYLNHFDQWSIRLNGRIDFRIIRGLSFNVRGSWAAVRDQRYLPAEGQTDEEILLRQGALATNSEYEINFGVTYQFGSIFNNVVNPRFSDNRGGFGGFGFGGFGGGGGGF